MTTQAPKLPPGFLPLVKNEATGVPEVCMGLLCPKHGACQNYANVEGSDPEGARFNSCKTGADFPKFVRLSERVSRR